MAPTRKQSMEMRQGFMNKTEMETWLQQEKTQLKENIIHEESRKWERNMAPIRKKKIERKHGTNKEEIN